MSVTEIFKKKKNGKVAGAVRIFTLTRNLFARITIEEDSRRE
jgi:hypothetical protein